MNSGQIVQDDIYNDMLRVRSNTLYTMCNSGGYPALVCSEDRFWHDRIKYLNPSLLRYYNDISQNVSISYYEFNKLLDEKGVLEKIIYPIRDNAGPYFLVDIKQDPLKYPYFVIPEEDETKKDSKDSKEKTKWILIPDVLIFKSLEKPVYMMMKFKRTKGLDRDKYLEAIQRAEVVQPNELRNVLSQYIDEEYFNLNPNWTDVKKRYQDYGILKEL